MTDKLQSDAVMWGILKAVGVLALVGSGGGHVRELEDARFLIGIERWWPSGARLSNEHDLRLRGVHVVDEGRSAQGHEHCATQRFKRLREV